MKGPTNTEACCLSPLLDAILTSFVSVDIIRGTKKTSCAKQRESEGQTVRATIAENVFQRKKPHRHGFLDAVVERMYRDQGLLVKDSPRCIIHGNSFISDEAKPPDPNVVIHYHAKDNDDVMHF